MGRRLWPGRALPSLASHCRIPGPGKRAGRSRASLAVEVALPERAVDAFRLLEGELELERPRGVFAGEEVE